ncbi:hypothetical protein ACFVT2_38545, partial [Streptomyces sp. NPDC058000]|uniref:hypothetical protein n=1 Tax=Streptomyces sp. NPDC058000 TaxID=3346299 RepID=UPI0036E3E1B8
VPRGEREAPGADCCPRCARPAPDGRTPMAASAQQGGAAERFALTQRDGARCRGGVRAGRTRRARTCRPAAAPTAVRTVAG